MLLFASLPISEIIEINLLAFRLFGGISTTKNKLPRAARLSCWVALLNSLKVNGRQYSEFQIQYNFRDNVAYTFSVRKFCSVVLIPEEIVIAMSTGAKGERMCLARHISVQKAADVCLYYVGTISFLDGLPAVKEWRRWYGQLPLEISIIALFVVKQLMNFV